jgi:glucose uptake protein
MILSAVCWGSWAITQKLAPKWRFELYYLDFSLGTFLGALLICFTAGSFNSVDITFMDSMIGISLRKVGWALAAGFVASLGNAVLVSAVSAAGMSVAFPIALSVTTIIGLGFAYFVNPQINLAMTAAGIVTLVLAVVVNARAYRMMAEIKRGREVVADQAATAPAVTPTGSRSSRVRKSGKSKTASARGVAQSVIAGVILGGFLPLLELSRNGDLGLAPYSAVFFVALGLLLTSLIVVPFMMNFPVEGEPLEFRRFTQGSVGTHLLGVVGGLIWTSGVAFRILAASVPKGQQVGDPITIAATQGAPILAALLGILFFREFFDSGSRVKMQLTILFVLLILALALTSMAPLY